MTLSICLIAGAQVYAQDDVTTDEEEDASYVLLLNERRVEVEKDGEMTTRIHRILEVRKPAAIEQVGEVYIPYNSYREKATFISASTRQGETVYKVERSAVRDIKSAESSDYSMYSDARELSFSMPSVQVGAILEYEVEVEHHRPVIDDNAWDRFTMQSWVPVKEARYVLKTPKSMEPHIQLLHLDVEPVVETKWWTTTRTWTIHDIDALEWEEGMPPWQDVMQAIRWTTLDSWKTVQDWYTKLAGDKAVLTPELKQVVAELTADCKTDEEKVRALYLFMQKDIRYVGLELGRSAYEPHAADTCLGNRYGDCKDQAVLLATMLREAGLDAHLALVRSVYEGAVDTQLPSPAAFNHMIVYVPHESGDFWLDSTVKYMDERSHPAQLDNAQALIVGLDNVEFLTIPPIAPEKAISRRIYEINLCHDGYARIKEIDEYTGRLGASTRVFHENMDKSKRREQLEEYVRGIDASAHLVDFGNSDPYDLSKPCQDWTIYEYNGFFNSNETGLSSFITGESLADRVELPDPEAAPGKTPKPRVYPWVALSSRGEEILCVITLPPTMKLEQALPEYKAELPQGWVHTDVHQEGQVVYAFAGVYGRPARIEAADLPKQRLATQDALAASKRSISLTDEIDALLTDKKPEKARLRMDELVKQYPDNAAIHHQRGLVYETCGRYREARLAYRRAIDLEPTRMDFYGALALTHAGYAGYFSAGIDHEQMEAIYREAIDHVYNKTDALWELADIYLHDEDGDYLSDKLTTVDKAVAVYQEILAEEPEDVSARACIARLYANRKEYAKAQEWYQQALEKAPADGELKQGLWECDAFLGHIDEAILAIRTASGDHDAQQEELQRIGMKLLAARRYKDAARLLDVASRLNPKDEALTFWKEASLQLSKDELLDYTTFAKTGTPLETIKTFYAAMLSGDKDRLAKVYSPNLQVSEKELQATVSVIDTSNAKPHYLDVQFLNWELEDRELLPGYREVSIRLPDKIMTYLKDVQFTQIKFMVEQHDDQWQIAGLGKDQYTLAFLARVADSLLTQGDVAKAAFFGAMIQEQVRSNSTIRNQRELPIQLAGIDYPDEELLTKAMVGLGLRGDSLPDRGITRFTEVAARMPDELTIKRALAEAYVTINQQEKACEILSDVVARDKEDARSLLQLAIYQMQAEKQSDSLATVDKLGKLLPAAHVVDAIRLNLLLDAQRPEEALVVYNRCKDRFNSYKRWETEVKLCALRRDADELGKLSDASPKEIYRSPEGLLATAWQALGNHPRSIAIRERKIQNNPYESDALVALAQELLYTSEQEEAASIYARLKRSVKPTQISDPRLGILAIAMGDFEQAETYLIPALEAQKHSMVEIYTQIYLGLSRAARNDQEGARRCYDAALAANPEGRWPMPLIRMLRGEIDLDAAIKAADQTDSDLLKLDRHCEANCYAGMQHIADNPVLAKSLLKAAVATKSYISKEHTMAQGLLLALDRQEEAGN